MSLATNLSDFATRVAVEFKSVRAVMGSLTSLTTTNKTTLVAAINEVRGQIGSGTGTGGSTTTDASQLTSGTLPAARIGDASIADAKLAAGTALTAAERTKLSGIAANSTANSSDAYLLSRTNHTGSQSADTVVDGSTNHVFTVADDNKLGGIASGATANRTDTATDSLLAFKAAMAAIPGIVLHDGSAGGGTRPSGWLFIRWIGGTTRPTNMLAGDTWEHDA